MTDLTIEELRHRAFALEQSGHIRQLLEHRGEMKICIRQNPPCSDFTADFSVLKHPGNRESSLEARIRAMLLTEAEELERFALTGTK